MIITIQIIAFVLYISYIVAKYGILSSISDSWYMLPFKEKLLFTFFIWSIGVPIMGLYDKSWLFVASGIVLSLVGVSSAFRSEQKWVRKLHVVGATGGIILAYLGLLACRIYYPFIIAGVISLLFIKLKIKNETWWIEVIDFVLIITGIIDLQHNS